MENDLKPQPERNAHFRSVVKLFCSTLLFSSRPLTWSTVATACANFALPWQVKAQKSCNGSGFMIQHDQLTRCVVTNAHVVENANSILVRRHGTARRFTAKVLCLGYQCDLALLTVDDEAFWRDAPLLQLSSGDFPHLQQSVIAVGYPTGGDAISVTSGVVSRIGVRNYGAPANIGLFLTPRAPLQQLAGSGRWCRCRSIVASIQATVVVQSSPTTAKWLGWRLPV